MDPGLDPGRMIRIPGGVSPAHGDAPRMDGQDSDGLQDKSFY